MPLLAHIHQALTRLGFPAAGTRLVVAVSGGADSLCLLHLLWRLQNTFQFTLHVAHLDHQFRGAESAADAQFVAEVAAGLGLPATVASRNVASVAHTHKLGKQAAARLVRYTFLAEVAATTQAHAVAVAHTADDQAETVLLHVLRGAGPAGLRAMRPSVAWEEWGSASTVSEHNTPVAAASRLIRPLLEVPRTAIEAYCKEHGLVPRNDPSNAAQTYTRNRIRHQLLPLLADYNPAVVAALGRSARICSDDYDYLQRQIDDVWPRLARTTATAVRFDPTQLHALHPALRRYALRRAVTLLRGPAMALDFAQIEEACSAAMQSVGTHRDLALGLRLDVVHGAVVLSCDTLTPPADVPQLWVERLELPPTGSVALPESCWEVWLSTEQPHGVEERWVICLDADACREKLALRQRKPGDRVWRTMQRGSRRIQDLFVDHKIPREQRAGWPLLVCDDTIIWVPGLAFDQRFAASPTTKRHLFVALVIHPTE